MNKELSLLKEELQSCAQELEYLVAQKEELLKAYRTAKDANLLQIKVKMQLNKQSFLDLAQKTHQIVQKIEKLAQN